MESREEQDVIDRFDESMSKKGMSNDIIGNSTEWKAQTYRNDSIKRK